MKAYSDKYAYNILTISIIVADRELIIYLRNIDLKSLGAPIDKKPLDY